MRKLEITIAADVTAAPVTARVISRVDLEENPNNHLLMQAMGFAATDVIGPAAAAGLAVRLLG